MKYLIKFSAMSVTLLTIANTFANDDSHPFHFHARSRIVAQIQGLYTEAELRKEPTFFTSSYEFARKAGGPITQSVLDAIQGLPHIVEVISGNKPGYRLIIDSRTHALHEGEYGAIPGWHTDFVPRPKERGGQPDYGQIDPSVLFYMVNMSNHPEGVSNTEIITEPVDFAVPRLGVYQQMDRFINQHAELPRFKIRDGEILEFDHETIHQGTQAHNEGTRFFLRVAILKDHTVDEIRSQVQSYTVVHRELKRLNRKHFSRVGRLDLRPSVSEIKNETMLIDSSWKFAQEKAGPLTRHLMETLSEVPEVRNAIDRGSAQVNTRVHMLMKGQYPDLPYWRNGAPFSEETNQDSNEVFYLASLASSSLPLHHFEFLPIHQESPFFLEQFLQAGVSDQTDLVSTHEMVRFTGKVPYRSSAALGFGWKLSFWITLGDSQAPANKIVQQTRIYLEDPSLGW